MLREIVLDTETTGLDPHSGHRLVEIGCVELINHIPSGEVYHQYINPERDMPDEAFRVHGLSLDFLKNFPTFADVAEAFLKFIGDSLLVIHNAEFDMKFLNAELNWIGKEPLEMSRTLDTVKMARRKFPGQRANLDALCQRFSIDNSGREKHGALLDSELLAEMYLELLGGRQPALMTLQQHNETAHISVQRPYREPRPHLLTDIEITAHQQFLTKLKNPLWEGS